MTLTFTWFSKEKGNHIMQATFSHPIDAVLSALSKCGWENRLTLRITSDDGNNEFANWFDLSNHLPFCAPENWKRDYEYKKKDKFWNRFY